MNINKYRVAAKNRHSIIHDDKAIISCQKMSKINIFDIDVRTLWLQLYNCNNFYILTNRIRNHQTEFEIDRAILT